MRGKAANAASANASMLACWRTSSASATARRPIDSISAQVSRAARGVARGEHQIGAEARERARELAAQAAARAGDDGGPSLQLENAPARCSSWLQDHLHQARLAGVEPLEPGGSLLERRHGADQAVELHCAARQERERLAGTRRRRRRCRAGSAPASRSPAGRSRPSASRCRSAPASPPCAARARAVAIGAAAPTASNATSTPRPPRELGDPRGDVVARAERDVGAEARGLREPVRVQVDGDERAAARGLARPGSSAGRSCRSRPRAPCRPRRSALRRTACTATDSGSTIAACSSGTARGTPQTMRSGTTSASAKAPSRRYSPGETPITWRRSHRLIWSARQNAHSPQWIVESKVTRSPARKRLTSEPTASTTPAASWPITIGGMRRPLEPS